MPEPLVNVSHASRAYRRGGVSVTALVAASCQIHPRARIALVGPSGSGKSTLLHLMGGVETPSDGTVTWPALGPRETLRPGRIACVFQTASLVPSLSVVENVELPLVLAGSERPTRAAALAALERIDLQDLADKLPEELSGGQAQRVAVARALAPQPKLILADEPTGQLDHPTAARLLEAWLGALHGTDTALLVATHDPMVAKRLDVEWRMHFGKLDVSSATGRHARDQALV